MDARRFDSAPPLQRCALPMTALCSRVHLQMHTRASANAKAAIGKCDPPHTRNAHRNDCFRSRGDLQMREGPHADQAVCICVRGMEHLQMVARRFANLRKANADQKLDASKWSGVYSIVVTAPFRNGPESICKSRSVHLTRTALDIEMAGCAFRNRHRCICMPRGLHLQIAGCAFANRARTIYLL